MATCMCSPKRISTEYGTSVPATWCLRLVAGQQQTFAQEGLLFSAYSTHDVTEHTPLTAALGMQLLKHTCVVE